MGSEMSAERTRASAARKQLEDSLSKQTAEMQVLSARLQQSTDQHVAEIAALRATLQQAQKVSAAAVSEDQLRQMQRLHQEEKNQIEARCAKQMEDLLRHKDQQLEEIVQRERLEQSGQMAMMAQKVQELEQALQLAEQQAIHTTHEAHLRLEETERTKQLLEDRITTVDRELLMERSIGAQKEAEVRQELQRLCLENQALNLQLSNSSTNRDSLLKEKEDSLQELKTQLDDLKQSMIKEKEDSLQELKQSMAKEKEEAVQELKQSMTKEKEEAVQELKTQLEDLKQSTGKEKEDNVQDLTAQLEEQKRKNNELRDKNYKAMEALQSAEKSLVELKKKPVGAPVSQVHQTIATELKKLMPELEAPSDATAEDTASFASSLASHLHRLQEQEHSKAAGQVQHYKTVLSQTEELLNRLQSRIEAEEGQWRNKTLTLEADVEVLKQERQFWMDQCQKQSEQAKVFHCFL